MNILPTPRSDLEWHIRIKSADGKTRVLPCTYKKASSAKGAARRETKKGETFELFCPL